LSRHYPTASISRYPELVIENNNTKDIITYAQRRLRSSEIDDNVGAEIPDIVEEAVSKASGVFL